MQWKVTNDQGPEIILMLARNVEAATRSAGDAACYKITTLKPGFDVIQPDTGQLGLFAGIWTQVVAQSAMGLVQTYGYSDTVYVGLSSTTTGTPLKCAAGVDYLVPLIAGSSINWGQAADSDSHFCVAWAMEAKLTTAETAVAALIKGL